VGYKTHNDTFAAIYDFKKKSLSSHSTIKQDGSSLILETASRKSGNSTSHAEIYLPESDTATLLDNWYIKDDNIETYVISPEKITFNSILRDCDEYTELFYYGIAHIPLIFRAGFQIGDEGKVRLLHKDRNEQSVFKEISAEVDNYTIELKGHYDSCNKASKEMLVVVATSFPVSSKDLEVFNNNIGHELHFEMCNPSLYGVDSIVSYALMNRLRTGILNKMREIVSSANIEKIHLVLSTSSDFTFFLSQGFSKYHDPEIIVYQYDRSDSQKYPWGVPNKALPTSAII